MDRLPNPGHSESDMRWYFLVLCLWSVQAVIMPAAEAVGAVCSAHAWNADPERIRDREDNPGRGWGDDDHEDRRGGGGSGRGQGEEEEEEEEAEPGLLAMWTTGASHARSLDHVDWSNYSVVTVEDDVNWPVTNEAFFIDGPTDFFALRLVGRLEVPESGVWYLSLSSDAGARLFIDGVLVVNDDANHSFRTRTGMVTLDAGSHEIEIRYLERDYSQGLVLSWQGPSMASSTVIGTESFSHVAAEAPADEPGTGVKAYWIHNVSHAQKLGQIDWTGYTTTTLERNVAWEITNEPFYAGGPTDFFALRALATITIADSGTWTFEVGSDAGARLYIDGQLVVSDDANHSFRFRSGSITLEEGEHEFELHYLERDYSQGLVTTWRGPGDAYAEVIPRSALAPRDANDPVESGGLYAYWTDSASHAQHLGQVSWGSYTTQTTVSRPYWAITSAAFRTGGPTDFFAVRLLGTIDVPESGTWTFGLGSDAGAQLLIDGAMVISDDANHSFRFASGTKALAAGEHDIEIRYLERDYSQGLVATWKAPGEQHEEVIPTGVLTPRVMSDSDAIGGAEGLRAYWIDSASHAQKLGQIDWSAYDTAGVVSNVYWPITNTAFRRGGPTDFFAVRLIGTITLPQGGEWTFGLGSDAGARLFIDGQVVIFDDANHSFRFASGSVNLEAGAHQFEVQYLERDYSQGLVATWRGPGVAYEQVIPASAFSLAEDERVVDAGGGALRAYWTGGVSHAQLLGQIDWADFTNMTTEPKVAWRITNSALYPGGPTDFFAVRLVGTVEVPRSGNWRFKVGSDAGARLFIDGQLVVNDDANHSFRFGQGSITLDAGAHGFDLRYLERDYSQGLVATWQGPGDASEEVIPSTAFSLSDDEPVVDTGGGGLRAYWTSGVNHAQRLGEVDWSFYTSTTLEPKVAWEISNSAFTTGGATDFFALRLVGTINIPESGEWMFKVGSDAGARLKIDGQLVVQDEPNHSFRFAGGSIALTEGLHEIEVCYLERDYSQGLMLTWRGPSDAYEQVVPSSALAPAPLESPGGPLAPEGRLTAEWYRGVRVSSLASVDWSEPDETTRVSNVAWRITRSAFYPLGPTDHFALRIRGTLHVPEGGAWTFKIGSDAGAELYVDGQLVVSDDANHSFRFRSGAVTLEEGPVDFEVRYLERDYSQGLVVTWQGPNDAHESVIPASAFEDAASGHRRLARWRESNQRGALAGALRAEIRRRGMGGQLLTLREMGLDNDIEQLLAVLGASTVREALGAHAGVLTDLQRVPRGD
ncbi:MAG: hypothetical protein DYG94_01550 [Leptolyngbya sp. PLA3]|nr:MAG: hypothetical protein EDM82_00335 [Cyanobacteria bacterium CYA]MCE7967416.1 hypothetical protein [Leptolyngbya sp. PL-A3]